MTDTALESATMIEARRRVLDDLEGNHPRYLAELLRNGGLLPAIELRAETYLRALAQAREGLPAATDVELDEVVNHAVFEVNPDREDQDPLSAEEERLLQEFKEKHGLA